MNKLWIAARAILAGGAVYAISRTKLFPKYSMILPPLALVVAIVIDTMQARGAINSRAIDYYTSENTAQDVAAYLKSDNFNNLSTPLLKKLWGKLTRYSGRFDAVDMSLYQELIVKTYNGFSAGDKSWAFNEAEKEHNRTVFQHLVESKTAVPEHFQENSWPSIKADSALLLKHHQFNVKATGSARICRVGHYLVYIRDSQRKDLLILHAQLVNTLLDKEFEDFEAIYPRLQSWESFWGQPNSSLFDLDDGFILGLLWESAKHSRHFSEGQNTLLYEVASRTYAKLESTKKGETFNRGNMTGEMRRYLLKEKIVTVEDCTDQIQNYCWTSCNDKETAAVLHQCNFDLAATQDHGITALRSVIFSTTAYPSDFPITSHVEALLKAGAKYTQKALIACERQPEILKLLQSYPDQLLK